MAVGTGIISIGTKLSYSAVPATTYTDLPDLQDIPELGGAPDKVEVTTLADSSRRYINGLVDYGDLVFTFLYDNDDASASWRVLEGMNGVLKTWKVTLPDTTTFVFTGQGYVKLASAGVNAPLAFTLSINLNSAITITNPA